MKDIMRKNGKIKNLEDYGSFVGVNGAISSGSDEKIEGLESSSLESKNNSFVAGESKSEKRKKIHSAQKRIESEIGKNRKTRQEIQRQIERNLRLAKGKRRHEDVAVAKPLSKFRSSIGIKLIFMISLVVVLSLLAVTFIVSYFVSEDVRVSAEENNLTINARTSADCESRINSVVASIDMFMNLLSSSDDKHDQSKNASMFFERYADIVAIIFPDSDRSFYSKKFLAIHEIDSSSIDTYCVSNEDIVNGARGGQFKLKNASPYFRTPMMAIFSPMNGSKKDSCVLILYSSENLYESFSSGSVNQSYYVNLDGEVLVHPDLAIMMSSADWSDNDVVHHVMESHADNGQKHYNVASKQEKDTDSEKSFSKNATINGIIVSVFAFCEKALNSVKSFSSKMGFDMFNSGEYIGAYTRLTDSNSAVITTVELSVILEGVRKTTFRNLYLTGAILAIAIMIMWLYSRSISLPLKKLAKVADEINQANFNTPLFDELYTNTHDEVAVLMNSTKNEREILNMITRLTNIGVVRSVIRKEVDFEPHLKDITIFFSDIRGFTAISDGFNTRFGKDSGAEIIGFLNDYMSRMVRCIKITGGVVDKFEGDAIMACWGVLRNDSLEFEDLPKNDRRRIALEAEHEKHKKLDALSAISACVAMRYSLRKYNKDAELFTKQHEGELDAKYKPHIRIGSGLNSGRATVGFMGSMDKMEFTSIGDPVNLASRTESSNKPCGTDILITQDTYDLLKNEYIRCAENNFTLKPENEKYEVVVEMIPVSFEVKGKGKQHFYGVVNMPHFDVQKFFREGDENFEVSLEDADFLEKDFVADEDCLDVVGEKGPKTLKEMRLLLGIPEPDFGGVNLDEEENKIQVSAG